MADSAFSEKLPTLQLFWDSVSSGLMKECAYKYMLAQIEGWRSREDNIDLTFGILLHEGREMYYRSRARGVSHDDSLVLVLDQVLTSSWDEKLNRPWQGDERKNRYTLCRSLVWYLDHFENDPLETRIMRDGKPMVELSFRFGLGFFSSTNEEFHLCGHLDRVADYSGLQVWVNDTKTTKSSLDEGSSSWFFKGFTPDNQVSLYSYAASVVLEKPASGVMLDGVQIAQDFTRIARAPITRTRAQLAEWLDNFREMLDRANRYAMAGKWPQNDKACFRCSFRRVCALPPAERPGALSRDFVKRPWNPLAVRGE